MEIKCKNCRQPGWSIELATVNGWVKVGNEWFCAACHRWPDRDTTLDDPHERLS